MELIALLAIAAYGGGFYKLWKDNSEELKSEASASQDVPTQVGKMIEEHLAREEASEAKEA